MFWHYSFVAYVGFWSNSLFQSPFRYRKGSGKVYQKQKQNENWILVYNLLDIICSKSKFIIILQMDFLKSLKMCKVLGSVELR